MTQGETLLWQGAPMGNARITWLQVFMAAFGVPFAMVGLGLMGSNLWVLLAEPGNLTSKAMAFGMVCFGVPFAVAGLAMVFGPYLAARLSRHRVRYALSNRCLYVASRWWSPKMVVTPLRADNQITLSETNAGWNICVHLSTEIDSDGDKVTREAKFEMLRDGPEVYRLLRGVQEGMT